MKKLYRIFLTAVMLFVLYLPVQAAFGDYWCSAIKGGTTGAMDAINGNLLNNGDSCTVKTSTLTFFYHLDATSGAAESGDLVIAPDSNPGTKRWLLLGAYLTTLQLPNGTSINEISIDGTLAGNSDDAAPTEKAVKTYQDTWANGTTQTEMGYLHGVTSDIQTQISAISARSYVKVSEVQASGTQGGIFTSGAWQTRTFNTEDSDDDNVCTLSSNQITLEAGTYECRIMAPAHSVNGHKTRLRNTTGSVTLLLGTAEYSSSVASYATTHSFMVGKFTIAASQALEVQHYGAVTQANNGFGDANTFGVDEVYTVAEFWKVD